MVSFVWHALFRLLDIMFDVCHNVTTMDEHHSVASTLMNVTLWHPLKFMSHCNIHQSMCHIVTFIKFHVTLQQPSIVMLHHLWLWLTMLYYGWLNCSSKGLIMVWPCLNMVEYCWMKVDRGCFLVDDGLLYLTLVDYIWWCNWPWSFLLTMFDYAMWWPLVRPVSILPIFHLKHLGYTTWIFLEWHLVPLVKPLFILFNWWLVPFSSTN